MHNRWTSFCHFNYCHLLFHVFPLKKIKRKIYYVIILEAKAVPRSLFHDYPKEEKLESHLQNTFDNSHFPRRATQVTWLSCELPKVLFQILTSAIFTSKSVLLNGNFQQMECMSIPQCTLLFDSERKKRVCRDFELWNHHEYTQSMSR